LISKAELTRADAGQSDDSIGDCGGDFSGVRNSIAAAKQYMKGCLRRGATTSQLRSEPKTATVAKPEESRQGRA